MHQKILYILSVLERGGTEQQLYNLIKHMKPNATLVSIGGSGPWEQEFRDLGIEVIPLKRRGKADVSRIFQLVRIIRSGDYDIVHMFIDNVPGIYGHLAVLIAGHPRFITGERASILAQPAWYRSFKRLFLRRVRCITVNSQKSFNLLVDLKLAKPAQVRYIPNGIDLDRFIPKTQESNPLTIGMVGSLRAVKNPTLFVHAAARILQQQPDVRFMHIGGGEMLTEMRALAHHLHIDHAVTFCGLRTDVPDLLRQFDIFVLTSNSEGTPNAIMEAMAVGLPVVATDVGDVGKFIIPGENGYIVPTGDLDHLVERIEALIVNADLRRRMGQVSRERIQAYGLSQMAVQYEAVYAQVMREA